MLNKNIIDKFIYIIKNINENKNKDEILEHIYDGRITREEIQNFSEFIKDVNNKIVLDSPYSNQDIASNNKAKRDLSEFLGLTKG